MSTPGSGQMFDGIAPRYDLLNKLMSFGLDRGWRRELVARLQPSGRALAAGDEILDIATGTADVAIAIAKAYPEVRVVGLDASTAMLAIGRKKIAAAGLSDRIDSYSGDAQCLPFADARFAASCIAFGVRNLPDRRAGLREMARVTRPGGAVALLELGQPNGGLLSAIARAHTRFVVPWLGGLLGGAAEYRYLARSIAAFPPPSAVAAMMADAGLHVEAVAGFAFGSAHLYLARAGT